jgi:hypothetical protein
MASSSFASPTVIRADSNTSTGISMLMVASMVGYYAAACANATTFPARPISDQSSFWSYAACGQRNARLRRAAPDRRHISQEISSFAGPDGDASTNLLRMLSHSRILGLFAASACVLHSAFADVVDERLLRLLRIRKQG